MNRPVLAYAVLPAWPQPTKKTHPVMSTRNRYYRGEWFEDAHWKWRNDLANQAAYNSMYWTTEPKPGYTVPNM